MRPPREVAIDHLKKRRREGRTLSDCIFEVRRLCDGHRISLDCDLPNWTDLIGPLSLVVLARRREK